MSTRFWRKPPPAAGSGSTGAAGGVAGTLYEMLEPKFRAKPQGGGDVELPADMSTVSLVCGGLIAGESLAALSVGIYGLITSGALQKIFGG